MVSCTNQSTLEATDWRTIVNISSKRTRLSLLAGILFSTLLEAQPLHGQTPSPIASTEMAQPKPFLAWLEEAGEWSAHSSDPEDPFAVESRKHAAELLPKIIRCLSKYGDPEARPERIATPNATAGDGLKENTDDQARGKALSLLYALGRHAAPAIPDLVKALKDRDWKHRQMLANAFQFIGRPGSRVESIAVEDLKSPSETIRQQGVIMIAACAKYDEEMVTKLVEGTKDPSSLVRQTAIGCLADLMYRSAQAGPCLFGILHGGGQDSAYVAFVLEKRERDRRLGRISLIKHFSGPRVSGSNSPEDLPHRLPRRPSP